MIDINAYLQAIARQDEAAIISFFDDEARIVWNNTNEVFTPAQFAHINAVYPGSGWHCDITKRVDLGNQMVLVTHIHNDAVSLHAVSFMTCKNDKITYLEEYFSDDGEKPEWRKELFL